LDFYGIVAFMESIMTPPNLKNRWFISSFNSWIGLGASAAAGELRLFAAELPLGRDPIQVTTLMDRQTDRY